MELIKIKAGGNCLFRTFSCNLYNNEDKYMQIRMEIYKEALAQEETIKSFFLKDSPDKILTNIKVDNYIDKIKIIYLKEE